MRTIVTSSSGAFARAAADWVNDRLNANPAAVLALPTGATPIPLYAELVLRCGAGTLDLARTRIFNLDEYCGLTASDAHSYAAFLHRHLLAPLHIEAQARLLQGDASDLAAECRAYDDALADCGGIDVCILGLGVNGHIAFNEPGSSWESRTHVTHLSHSTRAAHDRQAAAPWAIPTRGLTMGIKTILESKAILLLIAGARKEAARAALYGGAADADWPVTSLIRHSNLTIIELCAPAMNP